MKRTHKMIVWVAVMLGMAAGVLAAAAPPAGAAAKGEKQIPMAEFTFHGLKVAGRATSVTKDKITIERPDGGTTGYPVAVLKDMRRYNLSESAYLEALGDHRYDRASEAKVPDTLLMQTRRIYRRALLLTTSDDRADRLRRKLDVLDEDSEDMLREALRLEKIKKAQAERLLIEAQKKEAEKRIAALDLLEDQIAGIHKTMDRMRKDQKDILRDLKAMRDDLEDIDEDIDDIEDRCRRYVTRRYVIGIKDDQDKYLLELKRLRLLIER